MAGIETRQFAIWKCAVVSEVKLTVAVLTYNSSRTLPMVLEAIRNQQNLISPLDLVIVDGGSVDDTFLIAEKYGARILHNRKTEMASGRHLAMNDSKSDFISFIDHDEVLENPNSLATKLRVFSEVPSVRAVVGSGYSYAKGTAKINLYINEFGDPFSFFMYRLSKSSQRFPDEMKSRFKVTIATNNYYVFDFSRAQKDLPLIEATTNAAIVDLNFLRNNMPNILSNPLALPHLFYYLRKFPNSIAITRNDGVLHYSAETLKNYFPKIKWRVINNVHYKKQTGATGFSGRLTFHSWWPSFKKFLFIPYGLTVIFPLIDSFWLAMSRRCNFYFAHVYFSFYTALIILIEFVKNKIGLRPLLRSYDGKSTIAQPDEKS